MLLGLNSYLAQDAECQGTKYLNDLVGYDHLLQRLVREEIREMGTELLDVVSTS